MHDSLVIANNIQGICVFYLLIRNVRFRQVIRVGMLLPPAQATVGRNRRVPSRMICFSWSNLLKLGCCLIQMRSSNSLEEGFAETPCPRVI